MASIKSTAATVTIEAENGKVTIYRVEAKYIRAALLSKETIVGRKLALTHRADNSVMIANHGGFVVLIGREILDIIDLLFVFC